MQSSYHVAPAVPSDILDPRNHITPKELSECDREPLHHIGSIQGKSGHLLFIQYPTGRITAHDEHIHHVRWIRMREMRNINALFATSGGRPCLGNGGDASDGEVSQSSRTTTSSSAMGADDDDEPPPEMIGTYLQAWVPFRLYKQLFEVVESMKKALSSRSFLFYTYQGKSYGLSLSSTTPDFSLVGIEIEDSETGHETADNFCSTLMYLGRIVEFYAHDSIAMTACDTIFKVVGRYDRGMVYKFLDDLSGEVIHEIVNADIETSYLGMRFPSSDILYTARQLYILNGLRYIHNVDEISVPIIAGGEGPLDLSHIRMRAVAKPHLIYLRNMGVVCSMSIAIVVDNELWGLLAFHGYKEPFKPVLHQRIACETISRMVSVRIEALVKKAESVRIIHLIEALMALKQDQTIIHNLFEMGNGLVEVLGVDVVVVSIQDPHQGESDQLVLGDKTLQPTEKFWSVMRLKPNREICSISRRQDLEQIGLSEEDCPACGVAYFREGRTQVMLGRAMKAREVAWAGNPDEPKLRIGGILNPRKSFETYMEGARYEARSWTKQDLNVLAVFRDRICEHSYNWMMNLLKHDIEDTNEKYLAAIDRAQDNYDFFARMSHELRTPFHGVMGCLDILYESLEGMTPQDARDIVRTAIGSGNHMINLLNDILDISKNKHLSHTFSRNELIYQSLAFECIDSMKSLAASRQVQFECSVIPNEKKVLIATDRTKVIQIVSNIVNNAIKFCTGRGIIRINFNLLDTLQQSVQEWVKSSYAYDGVAFTMKEGEMLTSVGAVEKRVANLSKPPRQSWVCISVADTGCGMMPTELVKMFAPYTQSMNGANRAFQGTGLGLFICVSLCHQLSGFLGCASTPGVGTVFHIGLPVEKIDDEAPIGGRASLRSKSPHSLTPDHEEEEDDLIVVSGPVLIADDNVVNLKILKRSLEKQLELNNLSMEVLITEGGSSCIELFKERRPGLVFIDYHMPGLDGVAATREIRAFEAANNLNPAYILSYTADATDRTKDLIFESGANNIMLKPPPKGFLAHLVKRINIRAGPGGHNSGEC